MHNMLGLVFSSDTTSTLEGWFFSERKKSKMKKSKKEKSREVKPMKQERAEDDNANIHLSNNFFSRQTERFASVSSRTRTFNETLARIQQLKLKPSHQDSSIKIKRYL